VTFPTAPKTEVTAKGDIVYSEVVRENVRKLEAYLEEMASGDTISGSVNIQKFQDDVLKLWTVVKYQPGISQEQKKSHQDTLRRSCAIFKEGSRTNEYIPLRCQRLSLKW
jgi:hypothetical protein